MRTTNNLVDSLKEDIDILTKENQELKDKLDDWEETNNELTVDLEETLYTLNQIQKITEKIIDS